MVPECGCYHDNAAVLASMQQTLAQGHLEEALHAARLLRAHILLTGEWKSQRLLLPHVDNILSTHVVPECLGCE